MDKDIETFMQRLCGLLNDTSFLCICGFGYHFCLLCTLSLLISSTHPNTQLLGYILFFKFQFDTFKKPSALYEADTMN